jgi:3-hexulose-6-phosphate synthase
MTGQLQVALDRMSLKRAVDLTIEVRDFADWIEVGTSLIKEFGMESVRRVVAAAGGVPVIADLKTNDNAQYEFELVASAGGSAATVMALVPDMTIDLCLEVAHKQGMSVVVDLLGADAQRIEFIAEAHAEAILAFHLSKDAQESGQGRAVWPTAGLLTGHHLALAGGISLRDVPQCLARVPDLRFIVGSAITAAPSAGGMAAEFGVAIRGCSHPYSR